MTEATIAPPPTTNVTPEAFEPPGPPGDSRDSLEITPRPGKRRRIPPEDLPGKGIRRRRIV